MAVTLKKVVVLFALISVFFGGLVGGMARVQAATIHHHAAISSSHQLALGKYPVCPPPPYICE